MNKLPVGCIEFGNVSKRYRLGALGTLRSTLAALTSREPDGSRTFWALKEASFRVEPGDSLGLIGPNGAGKTTTLKLLSSVTQPTSGRIHVNGRVSSLIELGAGFHPELSGRDNIFLNGAILGLSRHEIRRKLDAIIAFSELESFIDTPVKHYSSGMYVRLGFAVAAHVEPDILLVDEVLAVGDASFRHRCIQHMQNLRRNGTTIVFVSHNMHLVGSICNRALLLMHGQISREGEVSEVVREYENALAQGNLYSSSGAHQSLGASQSAGKLVLSDLHVVPVGEWEETDLSSDFPAIIQFHYAALQAVPIGRIVIFVAREEDHVLCFSAESNRTQDSGVEIYELAGAGSIEVLVDPLQLAPGRYYAVVRITDVSDSEVIASTASLRFGVHAGSSSANAGVFVPNMTWQHQHIRPGTDIKKG